jgi:hypothetical protein
MKASQSPLRRIFMDFVERWLGVAPDGGDGTFEALLILAVGLSVVGLAYLATQARSLCARREKRA